MASPTQTVVGKGIPNLFTAEGLLKILRDLISFDSPPKSLTNACSWNGRITQNNIHFPYEVIISQTDHVNTKPLIVRYDIFPGG